MLALSFGSAHAQQVPTPPQVASHIASDSRYEIVQSPLMARFLFRLDKVNGAVDQLVVDDKGNRSWERIKRLGSSSESLNGKAVFQLFFSGLLVRQTFLVNTMTGASWQLISTGSNAQETYAFEPLP